MQFLAVLVFSLLSSIYLGFHCYIVDGTARIEKAILVDQLGHGDYKTIQEAINSVPDGSTQWIKIHVTKGVYREKVIIPIHKQYILLEGEGSKLTKIEWDDHADATMINRFINRNVNISPFTNTMESATFTAWADNFVARDIGFRNTYNDNNNNWTQAVAVLVGGDKSSFHRCAFHGYQDTLCDYQGRHFFTDCWIEGAIDFIFGFGQSIYELTVINSILKPPFDQGWLTAHGKDKPSSNSGFVFKNCAVIGVGKSYLGRAWNEYSTVVFYRTTMSDIIIPGGWDAWYAKGHESSTTYAEGSCIGPGSNTTARVPWEKKLTPEQFAAFTSISFIDNEGWLGNQP